MPQEELFLSPTAPRDRVPTATRVRGTVIVASLRGLRRCGHGDRYLQALDPRYHDVVASLTAATWLPIDFAMAHYRACDNLALNRATVEDIGSESGRFVKETVLNVVAKLSKESGVTPWFALANANKLCGRTWTGWASRVWKLRAQKRASRVDSAAGLAVSVLSGRLWCVRARRLRALRSDALRAGAFAARGQDNEVSYRISWV